MVKPKDSELDDSGLLEETIPEEYDGYRLDKAHATAAASRPKRVNPDVPDAAPCRRGCILHVQANTAASYAVA